MLKSDTAYVTVSPPTFDRTAFATIDRLLPGARGPYCRDWLMARFHEGLQIRLLRPPYEGFIIFQPGRLAWRPVDGIENAVFVHDIRVGGGALATEAKRLLWQAVEEFAQFYGYGMLASLVGWVDGALPPCTAPGRGWISVDAIDEDARLVVKVLTGPAALPSFPRDWRARVSALGRGVTIQTTAECKQLNGRAEQMVAHLKAEGVAARLHLLSTPEQARRQAVYPGALYSVVLDGVRLGGAEVKVGDILRRVHADAV